MAPDVPWATARQAGTVAGLALLSLGVHRGRHCMPRESEFGISTARERLVPIEQAWLGSGHVGQGGSPRFGPGVGRGSRDDPLE